VVWQVGKRPVAAKPAEQRALGCPVKFSSFGPGNFHDFMAERGPAPDVGDALRHACRGPGIVIS
jgi:hypothetical protein